MCMCPFYFLFLIHCFQSTVKYSDHNWKDQMRVAYRLIKFFTPNQEWNTVMIMRPMQVAYRLITIYCFNPIQLTVEPHPIQSVDLCSFTPTQQKAQWWCSSVTQGWSLREWWQQCVGGMVSGAPTLEVSPVAPPLHPHKHSQRHPYWLQVLHLISLDLVRVNFEFCCSPLFKI